MKLAGTRRRTPTWSSTPPSIPSPSTHIRTWSHQSNASRLPKCRHILLSLLLPPISSPSTPSTRPPPRRRKYSLRRRRQRIEERFLWVIRPILPLLLAGRIRPSVRGNTFLFRVLALLGREGRLVKTCIGTLEIKVGRGYIEFVSLDRRSVGVMSATTASADGSVCPTQIPNRTLDRLERCSSRLYRVDGAASIGARAWDVSRGNRRDDLRWLGYLRNDVWLLWVRHRRRLLRRRWLRDCLLLIRRTIRRILGWWYPRCRRLATRQHSHQGKRTFK